MTEQEIRAAALQALATQCANPKAYRGIIYVGRDAITDWTKYLRNYEDYIRGPKPRSKPTPILSPQEETPDEEMC